MDRRTDAELVIAARKGDVDAFAALVERYRQPALRVAYGIAGNEAEDAVQDGFVKAFRSLDGFRDRRRVPARGSSRSSRTRRATAGVRGHAGASSRCRSANNRSRPARPPTTSRRSTTNAGSLLDVVAALPDRYREVVSLRYFAGLSESETGRGAVVPARDRRSRDLSRALNLLRAALGEEVTL